MGVFLVAGCALLPQKTWQWSPLRRPTARDAAPFLLLLPLPLPLPLPLTLGLHGFLERSSSARPLAPKNRAAPAAEAAVPVVGSRAAVARSLEARTRRNSRDRRVQRRGHHAAGSPTASVTTSPRSPRPPNADGRATRCSSKRRARTKPRKAHPRPQHPRPQHPHAHPHAHPHPHRYPYGPHRWL